MIILSVSIAILVLAMIINRWPDFFKNIRREDMAFFSGLGLLGSGLYQYEPWVAYTTVGLLLIIISFLPFLIKGGK